MVENSLWYPLVRYDNLFKPKAFQFLEFWRIPTLLNWFLNGEWAESSFFCQDSKPWLSTCASQICRKCSRPVLADKMLNIIDILPGAIQQGITMQENKPSGAARLLLENKASPLPWPRDTAGQFTISYAHKPHLQTEYRERGVDAHISKVEK